MPADRSPDIPAGTEPCQSGRRFPKNGEMIPCPNPAIHGITVYPDKSGRSMEPLVLCDECFQIAFAQGLVSDPLIGKEEYDRREAVRQRLN